MKRRIKITWKAIIITIILGLLAKIFIGRELDLAQYRYLENPTIVECSSQNLLVVEAYGDSAYTTPAAIDYIFRTYKALRHVHKRRIGAIPHIRVTRETPLVYQYTIPIPSTIKTLPHVKNYANCYLASKIEQLESGKFAQILSKGIIDNKDAKTRELEDYINRNNYRIKGVLEEEYLHVPIIIGPLNLNNYTKILRYHVVKEEPIITWRVGYEYPGDIRKVPFTVNFTSSEIASIKEKKRFEVSITFRLNPSDSLYKPGERFFIHQSDTTGSERQGDHIEYANKDNMIIDDNNRQVTFLIRFSKGNRDAYHIFGFFGGRIRKDQTDIDQLPNSTKIQETDRNLGCLIMKRFLQDYEVKKRY